MDLHIQNLIDKFNNGTATREERLTLLNMVIEGKYTDAFGDAFEKRVRFFLEYPELVSESEHEEELTLAKMADARLTLVSHVEAPRKSIPTEWYWGAAAVVVILLLSSVLFLNRPPKHNPVTKTFRGKQWVVLPDKSTVILNDNSWLSFNDDFGVSNRTVIVVGEAFFDIKHDPEKPFLVNAGPVTTRVLGTAFNINAYSREEVVVTVVRGKVQVSSSINDTLTLVTANEQLTVKRDQAHSITKKEVEPMSELGWKSDFLIFKDTSLEEAARQIGEKFGMTITFEDPRTKTCRISAVFIHGEDVDAILNIITKVFHLHYERTGNTITILGTETCH